MYSKCLRKFHSASTSQVCKNGSVVKGFTVALMSFHSKAIIRLRLQYITITNVCLCYYRLTFLTFACMNICGGINWCGFDPASTDFTNVHKAILMLDGTFSSITSLNFFLCALSEYGLLKIHTYAVQLTALVCIYSCIAVAYYYAIFYGLSQVWTLLYMGLTKYSSTAFFMLTVLRMVVSGNFAGSPQLFASILVGITGIQMLGNRKIQEYFCNWMNGYFDGMNIWYIQSDISLAFLLGYFIASNRFRFHNVIAAKSCI
uniref:Uncharacterized protein n=1 Tax=Aplanochytrium stocchinoi TaxID=215587 RepID=A0A7S3PPG2_9STRA